MELLLKLGDEKYINDMYDKEYLFFNNLSAFRNKEKDTAGRLDPREANINLIQGDWIKITLPDGKEVEFNKGNNLLNCQINEFYSTIPGNICCLYRLEIDEEYRPKKLNSRIYELGNKAILILDKVKFFQILDKSIEDLGYGYTRKKVEYYNPKIFNGELSFHHKDKAYSFQNEYRVLIKSNGKEPISVPMKGLKDISCILNVEHIKNLRIEKIG
ncbi:hypothetical protein [Marinifilum sp.]|uniref:hypothetical protein n=1 Tax=Marinifilum sp. TaxID=2033137 RepID=UPI003BAA14B5